MQRLIYKERYNTDSMKWDGCGEKFGEEDLLPLWVADMDFEVPLCVKEAVKKYADFGVFGYYHVPNAYYEAFIRWEAEYHDYHADKEWIRFAPGVVPAFNWLIHMLSGEGDAVIITPPVYYPFREAIENNHRSVVESPLVRTERGYEMDYADFEEKIVQNQVKIFVFCNPHNPAGRVWNETEIRNVLDICKKHGVYVISDEIHQDLVMSGYKKVTAAVTGDYDDILITLTAASKSFNLAGLQNSILIIPNQKLRSLYDEYMERLRIKGGNAVGYIAAQSAYEGGREWLDAVLHQIESNYILLKNMLQKELPEVWIANLEATYLAWIDLGGYISKSEIEGLIQKECKLAVDYGSWFGGEAYGTFIRINLATSRENIELAARRIIQAIKERAVI